MGYDVVIGSREGQGAHREGEPFHRHLMGRVFNGLVRLLVVGNFNDTQCGFKAFRRPVAHDLFRRARIYGDDAPVIKGAAVTAFDVEILYLAVMRGYRVAELPVSLEKAGAIVNIEERWAVADGVLSFQRTYTLNERVVPPERYDELRAPVAASWARAQQVVRVVPGGDRGAAYGSDDF